MDIRRSVTFIFKDPQWFKKMMLGTLMMLMGVFLFGFIVVLGYLMRILACSLDDVDTPLPEWKDFSGLLMEGIYPCIIGAIYSIPSIFFVLIGAILVINGIPEAGFLILVVLLVTASAISTMLPVAFMRYIITGNWKSAFSSSMLLEYVMKNKSTYFPALTAGSSMIMGLAFAGLILPAIIAVISLFLSRGENQTFMVITYIFTGLALIAGLAGAFIGQTMAYYFYGQAYRAGKPFPDDVDAAAVRGSIPPDPFSVESKDAIPPPPAPAPESEENSSSTNS